MKKSWIELRLEIHPSLVEAASNFLIEQGSPGVTQEEIKRRSGPKRERLIAYFPGDLAFSATKKKINSYLKSICQAQRTGFSLSDRTLQEEKWAEAWKENFKPMAITPRLVIKPP